MVAAGNDGAKDIDDFWPVFPCIDDLANIICVAATDSHDQLADFSNYGPTSVDVAAPGVSTLSAGAYHRVFFDDFETSGRGWVTGGTPNTWARTTSVPLGAEGTWLTESPDGFYPENADNWARTPALDLSGRRNCAAKFYGLVDTESWWDFFYVEGATSPNGPWVQMGHRWAGFLDRPFDQRMPSSLDGARAAYVRIRLNPDDRHNYDGIYVDDFAVECTGVYSAGSFQYLSGTSMATPHVSGVAALVLARNPGFSTAQLRAKVLASVDTKASLAGKVATGGRINAHKAVTGGTTNTPPTADAGADQRAKFGATVTLRGSGSDPEGGPVTYLWSQVQGPAVTLRNGRTAVASFTAPSANATFAFRLRVTDGQGASTADDVMVAVRSK